MTPWRPHTSNRCPVAGDRLVRPRIACVDRATAERREFTKAAGWRWTRSDRPTDIAEYQVQA